MTQGSMLEQLLFISSRRKQVPRASGNLSSIELPDNTSDNISRDSIHAQWIVSMAFSVTIAAITTYIVFALLYFGWKKQLKFSGGEKRRNALLVLLTLFCAWAILIYFLVELPLFVQQYEPFCAVQQRVTTICGIVTFGSVYFALWFRVYSLFYSNPVIKKESTRAVHLMSKATVVLLILMLFTNSTIFLSAPSYETTAQGCHKLQSRDGNALKWGVLVTSTVAFQATLLYLFVHPLCLHRKQMLHHGFDANSVMPVIRRAFVTAAICIVSDSVNAVFAISNSQNLNYIRHTAYGCNMVVNMIALICSFADWRKRLVPCLMSKRTISRNGTRATHVYSISP